MSAELKSGEMREYSAVVRLCGQHCPLPQCGAVAEIRRNDRRLVQASRVFVSAELKSGEMREYSAVVRLCGQHWPRECF